MSEESKIALFRPASDFPLHKREKARCLCGNIDHQFGQTPNVWVDEATRDLECRACGSRIDPYDYLWHVATEGDSLLRNIKSLREDIEALKAQKILLEEQNRELRADGRKLAK